MDVTNLPEGTWDKRPFDRGKDIDGIVGNNTGSNYPVIDKIDENGVVTSVKSRDLSAKTYQNGKTLENTIKKDIDKLAGYKGANWGGTNIKPNQITGKQLQIVIPNQAITQSQINSINSAIEYGNTNGIKIIITIGR
ncbi:MAG: hypothetical protein RR565_11140 [Erysipelothrix sp.]